MADDWELVTVLIETLWNVKHDQYDSAGHGTASINRNIVECKERQQPVRSVRLHVLIETLWNVKHYRIEYNILHLRINRNIVECKEAIEEPVCLCSLY